MVYPAYALVPALRAFTHAWPTDMARQAGLHKGVTRPTACGPVPTWVRCGYGLDLCPGTYLGMGHYVAYTYMCMYAGCLLRKPPLKCARRSQTVGLLTQHGYVPVR